MEKVSEDVILKMIEKEDPRTFETILSTYKTQVYRTALMILKNEADAEEAGTAPGRDPPCVHLHV